MLAAVKLRKNKIGEGGAAEPRLGLCRICGGADGGAGVLVDG